MTGRAAAMARRVAKTAARAGIDEAGVSRIDRALDLALRPRRDRVRDEHDPALLHPARTALIVLGDAGEDRAAVVAAGTLVETVRTDLAVPPDEIEAALGTALRDRVRAVPDPAGAGEALLERLVTADHATRIVALAERLDHARHLHLRPDREWASFHAVTCEVYGPVAERTHPVLARRFQWWCGMFARRHLGRSAPGAPT